MIWIIFIAAAVALCAVTALVAYGCGHDDGRQEEERHSARDKEKLRKDIAYVQKDCTQACQDLEVAKNNANSLKESVQYSSKLLAEQAERISYLIKVVERFRELEWERFLQIIKPLKFNPHLMANVKMDFDHKTLDIYSGGEDGEGPDWFFEKPVLPITPTEDDFLDELRRESEHEEKVERDGDHRENETPPPGDWGPPEKSEDSGEPSGDEPVLGNRPGGVIFGGEADVKVVVKADQGDGFPHWMGDRGPD